MPYATLKRLKTSNNMSRDASTIITWTMEVFDARTGETKTALDPHWTNKSLMAVLTDMERGGGYKLVGQDGPDTFILHTNP